MPQKRRPIMALLAMSLGLVIAVGVSEWAVRLIQPQDLSGTWLVSDQSPYPMNKVGGTARHQSGDRVVTYRFNENHHRGAAPSTDADLKALCLGDSFTFGWLVEEQDSFVGILESQAQQTLSPETVRFMNGGVGGWGTAHYTAYFEEHGTKLNPNVVIVFFNFLDVQRSQLSRLYRWTNADRRELTLNSNPPEASPLRTLAHSIPCYPWLLEHSHLIQFARRALTQTGHGNAVTNIRTTKAEVQSDVKLVQALFLRLARACRERQAHLIVISIGAGPVVEQVSPGEWSPADQRFTEVAPDFFASIDVPFIDLGPRMAEATRNDPWHFLIPVDQPNSPGHGFDHNLWRIFLHQPARQHREGPSSCRRHRVPSLSVDASREQAAPADPRQADDLLPADGDDRRWHS